MNSDESLEDNELLREDNLDQQVIQEATYEESKHGCKSSNLLFMYQPLQGDRTKDKIKKTAKINFRKDYKEEYR